MPMRRLLLSGACVLALMQSPMGWAEEGVSAETSASATATPLSAAKTAELDAYIEKARRDWRVPGLAIAVVRDDKIVYIKGFGQRDIAKNLPVTADTLFVGASTTKAFTSAGVGILVDEGKLKWDEPVQAYLPNFDVADKTIGAQITLRDMLSHRSGMPRHDAVWYNNNDLTRADIVTRLPYLQASAPLRSKWQYNNMMYMTAGHVVEKNAGTSWEEFTRARLFKPLGMTRTNFSVAEMERDGNHASAYKLNEKREITPIPLRKVDFIGPAGSINSTAHDYANWMIMHLNDGSFKGRRVLSKDSVEATHAPLLPVGGASEFPEFSTNLYGMGWFVDSYRGEERVQHGGNLDGFTARTTLFPRRKLGVVIFVNLEASPLPGYLSVDVFDRILGSTPMDWSTKMLARRDIGEKASDEGKQRLNEQRVQNTKPAHAMADYVGSYSHPGYGRWIFALGADGRMTGTYNGMTAKFEHWHYEQFNGMPVKTEDDGLDNTRANFITDLRGRVGAVQIEMDPLVPPIEFAKQADAKFTDPATLARYVGAYKLRDQVLTVELNGARLVLTVPGQSPYALVPEVDGTFALEVQRAIGVKFVSEGDRVVRLQMLQPDGVFDAERMPSQK
jgi:CubicO group peptidase (beta-lactamase class C family)